jgi:glycerol kinase
MQLQSDLLGVPVERPRMIETTTPALTITPL